MKNSCGSFIRISIFGKTLEQLARSGVDLEKVLANLGCHQVWLQDVPFTNLGEIENSEETLLMAEVSSKEKISGTFPEKSGLLSSANEERISASFVDSRDDSLYLSLSDYHIPRCSTPNLSNTTLSKSLFGSNIVSRIRSRDDLFLPIAEDLMDNVCVQAENNNLLQSDYETDEKVIMELLNSLIEILPETEYIQKNSFRETIVDKPIRSKISFACYPTLPMFQSPQLYTCHSENIRSRRNVETQRFKSLPDIYIPSLDTEGQNQHQISTEKENFDVEPSASQPFSPNYEPPDFGFEEIEIDHNENNQNVQREVRHDVEQSVEKVDVRKEKNTVCAADPPTKKRYDVQKKYKRNPDVAARNVLHNIKCEFMNCKKVYKWRPKYGKLRLFDHAMTHLDSKKTNKLSCHICGHKTSLRSLREHMYSRHPEEDNREYSIKEVLRLKVPSKDVMNVWEKCFRENLELVGKPQVIKEK